MPRPGEKKLLLLLPLPLLLAGLPLLSMCATTGSEGEADLAGAGPSDGGVSEDGGDPTACFMGNPQSEAELLNRCTDAERVDRAHRIPTSLWDGKGPLPLPPL